MDASHAHSAIAKLRNEPSPATLQVVLTDGKTTTIAITTKKRWKTRAANILGSMEWASVQPLDSAGNVIGALVENEGRHEAGALEDLSLHTELGGDGGQNMLTVLHGLTKLMLKAQDVALDRQAKAYNSVLDNNQKLVQIISTRLTAMEAHAQKSFDTVNALHNRLNMELHREAGDDGEDLDSFAKQIVAQVMTSKMGLGPGPQEPQQQQTSNGVMPKKK